jgi:hypothetical protein
MRTLKKYTIFGAVMMSVIFSLNTAHADPMSRLVLSDSLIYPGDMFLFNVFIDGVNDVVDLGGGLLLIDEVFSFGFDVNYNPSEFVFNGATVNTALFNDDSLLSGFENTDVAGSINSLFGPSGDDILLASLSFTSLVAGDYSLGIVSDLSDPNEGLFALSGIWDITNSIQVSPVPEPATILLLTIGMAGMGVCGRKKLKK